MLWGKDEKWMLWTALMTLTVTNLVAFRTATTNFIVMLPVLLLICKIIYERWGVIGRTVTWVILGAFLMGLWWLFFGTVDGNTESAWMYLPFPFFCLFGLWWIRWWSVKPKKLALEEFAEFFGFKSLPILSACLT